MASPALKPSANSQVVTDPFGSPRERRVVLSLLLVLLSLGVYNPVAQNGFVNFDDPAYITANHHIQAGLTWQTVRWALSSTAQSNWHPLTWLSHAMDYQLFHLKPVGHHYVSVLLHALAVVLLFLFLETTTQRMMSSAVVAALFAAHPLNVESVAWASERKTVLCTVFFLLGLWAYKWYAQNPSLKRYLLVAVSFVLALMSKPMAITFPFVLLLLDYWPLERLNFSQPPNTHTSLRYPRQTLGRLTVEKLPLLVLSVASGIITVIAQRAGGALRYEYALPARTANAIVAYVRYLGKALWPTNLAALYPFPRSGLPTWGIVASIAVIVLISICVFRNRQRRYLLVGWCWFLGTMVPAIGLVQVGEQAMADRYAYIPFIGLFIAAIWGLADLGISKPVVGRYLGPLAFVVLAGLVMTTRHQVGYWKDGLTLWSHTLQVTPPNFVAEDNLGAELINQGNILAAREHFQAATEINPQDPFSQLDIGVCDKKMGNSKAAIEHYEAVLRLSTEPTLRSTALSNLGSLYRKSGNYQAAREHYAEALRIKPDNTATLIGLGLIAQKTGDLNGAVKYYSQALAGEQFDVGYVLLARALEEEGRKSESTEALDRAKKLAADFEMAQREATRLLSE